MAITTAADIEKLAFARDVLQEQIDARVVARDAQILDADPFFKARKTRLLAKYVGGLGFRILDYKSKEKPSQEASAAKLMFRIKDRAVPIFKDMAKKVNRESVVDFGDFGPEEKSTLIQLCEAFKGFGWISVERSRTKLKIKRGRKNQAIQFWNGGWAEIVNRAIIESTLQAFAKEHKLSYDIFYDVKLVRLASEKVSPDMQLDVVARVDDRFYVFETKTGTLGIDKWVDRAKLFSRDQKSRFITCCIDEKIPTQWFRPFCLVPLVRLEEEMLKWLAADCGVSKAAGKEVAG
jgi:hypothetical protein